MKRSSSSRRRVLSLDRLRAEFSTSSEAEPVSVAPRLTCMTLAAASCVPCATFWTLRAISCVAELCCSTALAIVEAMSEILPMVPPISLMAATEFLRRALHARDVIGDFVGRFRGLAGERLDLGRDHRKAAAGVAGAGGLDGGVQRQQIGLLGDRRDQLDDVADLLRGTRQLADAAVGLLGLADGGLRDLAAFLDAPADLVDGRRQFIGRGRHRLHVAGGFFRGAGDLARQALGGFGGACECSGRGFELHGRR